MPGATFSRKAHQKARDTRDYAMVRGEITAFLNGRLRLPLASAGLVRPKARGHTAPTGPDPMYAGLEPLQVMKMLSLIHI